MAPTLAESFLAIDGVVSRTVEDTALALDALAGYELGDASWAPPPEQPFARAVETDPAPMRIGFSTLPPVDVPVDPAHVAAVEDAAALLESLGHRVEPTDAPWQAPELFRMFTTEYAVGIGSLIAIAGHTRGREPAEEEMERLSWEMYRRGGEVSAFEHAQARMALQAFSRGVVGFMSAYDAFLTPTLAQRPVRIGEIDPEAGTSAFAAAARFAPFTAPINVSGQPAISLPLSQGADGLPTAVQLIGRPAGEWPLLALSAQIERARPWADRRPQLD
jgi:amidase